jgi:hypothetical protein
MNFAKVSLMLHNAFSSNYIDLIELYGIILSIDERG